jgi:hypothetical protein
MEERKFAFSQEIYAVNIPGLRVRPRRQLALWASFAVLLGREAGADHMICKAKLGGRKIPGALVARATPP